MTVRPVDINGMIQRTQDIGTLKRNEDVKPQVDQQNIQTHVVKQEERVAKEVVGAEDTQKEDYRYDAKEKGNSQYEGNSKGKKKREKEKEDVEGRVIVKGKSAGFDMKI